MATVTTRLQATKPASSENVDITILNNNFDLFDGGVGSSVGTSASRPASAFSGRLFYTTDSAKLFVNTAASASTVATWVDLTPASTVSASATTTLVRKTATTGRISTTTLADDPHITFALAASRVYRLTCHLSVSGAAAGDLKTAWNITGAASAAMSASNRGCHGPSITTTDSTDTNMRSTRHVWSTAVAYGLDGATTAHISEDGLLDTASGSGTLTLQWAQNTSTATSTVISTSSWAVLERLT